MNFIKLFVGVVAFIFTCLAKAESLQIHKGTTQFIAVGKPAMLKIRGEGAGPEGELKVEGKNLSGEISIKMETFQSGLSLRDEHMKVKYLETIKFPKSKIVISGMQLPSELKSLTKSIQGEKFIGKLTLHGVEKSVEGTYSLTPEKENIKVQAQFSIKISDYNIDIPSYAGLKIADTVDVETFFEVSK